jgi:hypothetical protein
LKPDSLHFVETRESRKARDDQAWDADWIRYRFTAVLICNNKRCQEPASVSGRGAVEMVQTSDHDPAYVDFFYPEHVDPSPHIIRLPDHCPSKVKTRLERAFVAVWGDAAASANHVRSALEQLMDALKQPRSILSLKGKREPLKLHQRIVNLARRDKEPSDSLLAVKWLGNVGSHTDELSRDDVFDAFDIVETVLDDLYVRNRDRVKRLVSVINKRKGPAPKTKKRKRSAPQ